MDPKDMQIQQLTAANGDLTKQIDTYKRLASLNDAQRAHYAKLSEEDRPGFLVKTSDERNAIIKACGSRENWEKQVEATRVKQLAQVEKSRAALLATARPHL